MRLTYTGDPPDPPGSGVSLPEGWPAADHDEPDKEVAAAKIASGVYAAVDTTTRRTAAGKDTDTDGD